MSFPIPWMKKPAEGEASMVDLRDWFAGQALAAMMTKSEPRAMEDLYALTKLAYRIADEMLRTRSGI